MIKPDTLVWRDPRAYNEPYVNYYLRHPAYRDYPVVGVSWLQANDLCKWRTDRVNEQIMVREGFLEVHNPTGQVDDSYFSTEAYLDGQYEEAAKAADDQGPPPQRRRLPQRGHDRRHPASGLPPAHRGRVGVRRPVPHRKQW